MFFNLWSSKTWIRIHLKCQIRIKLIRIHNTGEKQNKINFWELCEMMCILLSPAHQKQQEMDRSVLFWRSRQVILSHSYLAFLRVYAAPLPPPQWGAEGKTAFAIEHLHICLCYGPLQILSCCSLEVTSLWSNIKISSRWYYLSLTLIGIILYRPCGYLLVFQIRIHLILIRIQLF